MISIIRPITPNISPIRNGDMGFIIAWLIVLAFAGLSAFFVANYSANRFKTNPKKTAVCFISITALLTMMMLCFFGLSATTVKGIIISLVFILSSFEDIRTRECDDFLHVLILVAAFIGINKSSLIGMLSAAIFVFAVIMGTTIVSKGEIGGADIKMSVACAFLLGLRRGLLGLMLGLTLAIVINVIKKRKNKKEGFPMIPYLAVGFMTAYFI